MAKMNILVVFGFSENTIRQLITKNCNVKPNLYEIKSKLTNYRNGKNWPKLKLGQDKKMEDQVVISSKYPRVIDKFREALKNTNSFCVTDYSTNSDGESDASEDAILSSFESDTDEEENIKHDLDSSTKVGEVREIKSKILPFLKNFYNAKFDKEKSSSTNQVFEVEFNDGKSFLTLNYLENTLDKKFEILSDNLDLINDISVKWNRNLYQEGFIQYKKRAELYELLSNLKFFDDACAGNKSLIIKEFIGEEIFYSNDFNNHKE